MMGTHTNQLGRNIIELPEESLGNRNVEVERLSENFNNLETLAPLPQSISERNVQHSLNQNIQTLNPALHSLSERITQRAWRRYNNDNDENEELISADNSYRFELQRHISSPVPIPEQKVDIVEYDEQKPKVIGCCVGCNENYPNFANDPCGHIVYCGNCSKKVTDDRCPICKVKVEKYLQIFLP